MTKHPEFTPIKSSMMAGHAYDPATRALHVKFNNGAVYRYDDVSAERVEAMIGNASPGAYFTSKIKGLHPATKL